MDTTKELQATPIENKGYFTIAIFGRTGKGKSTTANKLLGIDLNCRTKTMHCVKEWTCETDPFLLKKSNLPEDTLLSFITGDGYDSVTIQCQMLSNEDTCIRVLDVKGFGGTNLDEKSFVNIGIVDSFVEIQNQLDINFDLVLYFLPFRGTTKRIEASFKDELATLFYYFEHAVFERMAIVATQEEEYQAAEFTSKRIETLESLVKTALKTVSGSDISCPPIIYIPLGMSSEDLLHHVRTAGSKVRKGEVLATGQTTSMYTGEGSFEEYVHGIDEAKRRRSIKTKSDTEDELLIVYRFRSRKRKTLEEWSDLTNALTILAKKAYPTKTDMEIEDLVKSRVLSNVQNHQRFSNDISLNELVITLTIEEVIPEPFSGEGDEEKWENWITNFEKKTAQRRLDKNEKIKWLKARLKDCALSVFTGLESDAVTAQCQLSYMAVKERIESNVYSRCFEERQKMANEELEVYAQKLSHLVEKAYPNQPRVEKCKLVLNRLKPYLHSSIQSKEWDSVDEALAVNCAMNIIKQPFATNDGTTFDEWLETFECKTDDYSLGDSTRLLWFESRLAGGALECYRSLPTESKIDYHSAKNAFRRQWFKNIFDSKCNLMEGNLKNMGKELSLLSAGAYPEMLESERQSMTLNYFLAIVSARGIQFSITPRTVNEAISFLSALECVPEVFHGVTGWEKWTKNVKRLICSEIDLQYSEMVRCIQTRLSGDAFKILESVLEDRIMDYEVLLAKYHRKLFDHWLHHRQKRKPKTWNSYVQDFISLAQWAHLENVEKAVLDHVLTQVNSYNKSIQWNSLDEAIDVISAAEEMLPFSNESNEDWIEWREKFELIAHNQKLNDSKMILCLGSLLNGNAQIVFSELQSNVHHYSQVIDSLTKEMYIHQFKSSKRNKTHTWGKYATELLSLVQKAYPASEDKEKIVLEHMLSQVSEKDRSRSWMSLDQAITVMSAEEEIPDYANEDEEWWEKWIEQFQNFAAKYSLDNSKKIEWLSVKLIRGAKEIFDQILAEDITDFDALVLCLGKKLRDKKFASAKIDRQKGLHEYARYLSLLVQSIHPEMSAKDQDGVVLARIVSEVSRPHELKHWTFLDDAIDVILAEEEVPVYCDQENWNEWKIIFQNAANKHGLNDKRKILWLSCLLSGEAKREFEALPENEKLNYDVTIIKLERNLNTSRFINRKKKAYETWEILRYELYSLAKECYPDTCNSELDAIVLKQLCSIIKGQGITLHEEPASVYDAILSVSAFEAVPIPYTEGRSWEKWIQIFEKALQAKKITENDLKLRYLQLRLTGKVSSLFSEIITNQRDYDNVKILLRKKIYTDKFEKRQKQLGETWRMYAADLKSFGQKIYASNELDKCVLDKLLSDPSACELKYNGDVRKWDAWISNFDQIVRYCDLNDDAMLKWFEASLVGEARTMFDHIIPKGHKASYYEAKRAMEKKIYVILFNTGVRAENESVRSFALCLEKYAEKAFSDDGTKMVHVLQKITELMKQDNIDTENLSFSTIDEAVTTFTAIKEMNYYQYRDGEDWEWWLSRFEKVVSRNGLKEEEKLQWLKACLTGYALEIFSSSHSTYESMKLTITTALKAHQQIQQRGETHESDDIELQEMHSSQKRLVLKKCTKCSGNNSEPMCHTKMVPLSEATSGIMSVVHRFEELMSFTDKVCNTCSGAIGTKGCTPIGSGVQHNC